jgi:hypothetical protein
LLTPRARRSLSGTSHTHCILTMGNTLVVTTVYTDPAIGLTVQAWPRNDYSWHLLFRVDDQYSLKLNERAVFYMFRRLTGWDMQPAGGWCTKWGWHPIGHRMVPPSALAAVEAWLAEQEAAALTHPTAPALA